MLNLVKNKIDFALVSFQNRVAGTEDEGISKGGNVGKAIVVVGVGLVLVIAAVGFMNKMGIKFTGLTGQIEGLLP